MNIKKYDFISQDYDSTEENIMESVYFPYMAI